MKKILVAGDVEGHFEFLFSKINAFKQKNQEFDFCLCVGRTLSPNFNLNDLISNKLPIPLPIYFIEAGELSPVLNTLYPEGHEICPNLHFLGKAGIKVIQGISVAYLSGLQSEWSPEVQLKIQKYDPGAYTMKEINSILIQKDNKEYKKGIDILLTSEWPRGFDSNIQITFDKNIEAKSTDVTTLVKYLKPRYHFVGLEDIFYKRAPYSNDENSYITRLISIAKIPKDATVPAKQQYLFALQLKNINELTPEELLVKTPDTTMNPYMSNTFEINKSQPYKMQKTEGRGGQEEAKANPPQPEKLTENIALHFSGFDRRTKDIDIEEFLSRWGDIQDFQLIYDHETGRHRGSGFVLFKELKVTQLALNESGKYSLQGRKIYFNKASKGAVEKGKLSRQNAECWFCLDNPNVAKELIVFVGEEMYIALDKGPINQHHLLIIPIDHYPNAISLPLKASDELQMLKVKLTERFENEYGELLIFYERYIKVTQNIAHMIVNAVPYKKEQFAIVLEEFEKRIKNARFNTFELKPEEKLPDLVYDNEYYFYLEIVNPASRRKNQFYAKRYLLVMKESEVRSFPKDYGRELYCDVMECRHKIDWKNCLLSEGDIKSLGFEFKKLLNK